jgi:hypothetical protein
MGKARNILNRSNRPQRIKVTFDQKSIPIKPLKKEDIKQEVFDLYDNYAHNRVEKDYL